MDDNEYTLMYQLEKNFWWYKTKRNFIKQFLTLVPTKKKAKILDIGCGTGLNVALLSQYGQTWGIDSSNLAVNYSKKRGLKNIQKADAQKLPFSNNTFNLVTLFDILYHQNIKSDQAVLKETFRVIKPGGYLLVTDCALPWLYSPHDTANRARQRYYKSELENKIEDSGFEIVRSSYSFFLTLPMFIIQRLVSKLIPQKSVSLDYQLSPLLNRLLLQIGLIESWLLKRTNLPLGSSIIILAQK